MPTSSRYGVHEFTRDDVGIVPYNTPILPSRKTTIYSKMGDKNLKVLKRRNSLALFIYFFFLLNILLLNSITFITAKNAVRMISVSIGFTGASVARSISGNPNTIAGKF